MSTRLSIKILPQFYTRVIPELGLIRYVRLPVSI